MLKGKKDNILSNGIKERFVKLESVGVWFDKKAGYTFPIIVTKPYYETNHKIWNQYGFSGEFHDNYDIDNFQEGSVHIQDTCSAFIEAMSDSDKSHVDQYWLNQTPAK